MVSQAKKRYEEEVRKALTHFFDIQEQLRVMLKGEYNGLSSWPKEERTMWNTIRDTLKELARKAGVSDEEHKEHLEKKREEIIREFATKQRG